MTFNLARRPRVRSTAQPITYASRKAVQLLGGLVLATGFAFAGSSNASAQICEQCVVTMQQVSNNRFVDAHEYAGEDYRLVTRPAQSNNTQLWRIKHLGSQVYTIQQVSNDRYVDAHEYAGEDYRLVTRPAQNNDTQRWFFVNLGSSRYTIQQVSSGRFVDAHEYAGEDYRLVTRPAQNNDTQRWRITIVIDETPPPPPPPVVFSQGTFDLMPSGRVNLDNGQTGAQGADLMSQAVNFTQLQLSPQNGAQINFAGGAQRGFAGCSAAAFSVTPVPLASVAVGSYVCMRTSEGRISEFRIDNIGPVLRVLTISYTTWQ